MVKVSRKGRRQQKGVYPKVCFFFGFFPIRVQKYFFFCLKIFDTLNVRLLFFVFECLVGRETLSFCVSSHLKTSSWLVPNKPLVNPPVRFVFFFATRRGGLFSLFSLFSLSLSLSNRKGVFLLRVFLVGPFWIQIPKTIRRVLVVVLHCRKSVSKQQRAFGRENARDARTTTTTTTKSSSFFAFLFPMMMMMMILRRRTRARRSVVDPFDVVVVGVILSIRFQPPTVKKYDALMREGAHKRKPL